MDLIKQMTGFKATDKNMCCQPDTDKPAMQYQLGVWYEVEGDLEMCSNGFHFCPSMSGVWSFYSSAETRVFKVIAEDVLDEKKPGAENKCCTRRIMLTEEVAIGGHQNTGDQNTGDRNTGNLNTGNLNTGNLNTGDRNTGDQNTGYLNTGDRNTGDRNTGHRNTGDGNVCDHNTGHFCTKKPKFVVFDKPCTMEREEYNDKFGGLHNNLCSALMSDDEFDYTQFSKLPNWSLDGIKALHRAHIEARAKLKKDRE